MARQTRFRRGTPVGYKHNWKYRERVAYDTGRTFKMVQSKSRRTPAKTQGGFKKGSKIIWNITGKETVKRTPQGYKHTITGIKTQGAYKLKGKRRWKKTKRR